MTDKSETVFDPATAYQVKPLSIYQIIPLIREETGIIRKNQEASGGARYKYRGTDTIINALAPALNKYGVFTTVEDIDFTHNSELTQSKKVLTTVTLRKKVRFYGPAGDYVESIVAGENSDYSDKATGGASTYAYRYALVQTFVLPTDDDDPDGKYVEKEAPASAGAPSASGPAPESSITAVQKRLQEKSKNVDGDVKGSAYLDLILASSEGDLSSKTLKDIWKDEQALTVLESLVDKA